jgi:eukaryotic-like serine/threonine-protein kinase
MTLSPGSRIGPYEILALLGSGGMGEVYRARDARLERTVAIKILPAQFSSDSVRRQRFEREARTISGLSHPNICVLHDIGRHEGLDYLVMECIEGETLARRLEKGPLPQDQVLKVGAQIAEALEAAHRSGIVHRDLKPGNIMLTASGAKLLDFGLARSGVPPAAGGSLTALATHAAPMTQEGLVLGTFQYMSPEQVEGKDLDGRSDIFSLGAVLFEMLTGRRAFAGKSQLSVASAILEKDPDSIAALKPSAPPALDHAVRLCLAKDPAERWQSARDLALELRWIAEGGAPGSGSAALGVREGKRSVGWIAALGITALAALALGYFLAQRAPARPLTARASIKPMPNSSLILFGATGFAVSPDGRRLVYVGSTPGGKSALWIRPIDSLRAEILAGTDGASYPFWSPDSRFVGFFAGGKLKTIDASGGPALTLCEASDGRGGSWNRDGTIIFTPGVNAPIVRVAASGGSTTPVTALDASKREVSHRWPFFLPDGKHFLYMAGSVFTPRENPTNSILVGSLDSKEGKFLLHTHANAVYASGRILFLRQDTLMAQPFDPGSLELSGEAVPVADPVHEDGIFSRGLFSASANGLLAYIEGTYGSGRQLAWFDRGGKQVDAVPGTDAYASPRISPDGKALSYYLDATGYEVYGYDIARGIKTALTFGSGAGRGSLMPIWSPDGRRIAYTSYNDGKYDLYQKASDGSGAEQLLLEGAERYRFLSDWSPDGKLLAYYEAAPGGWGIWILPADGKGKAYRFLESPSSLREPSFSPDGQWIAYESNESGEYRVYIVPFPGPGGKWQVSPGGGLGARWRRDGKEIFYLSSDNKLMATEVKAAGSTLELGASRPLFETRTYGVFGRYDVSADGQRFLIAYEAGQPDASITLAVNWPAELEKK